MVLRRDLLIFVREREREDGREITLQLPSTFCSDLSILPIFSCQYKFFFSLIV